MDTVCFVLLALLRVSGCLEHIPITGNCSDDASTTGERLEVFGITKTKITCNVLKSEDCGPLPGVFGGNSIGRPRDFRVEPITVNKTEGYVPVAVFKWKPSSSGVDAVHLKGFQLKIRKILGSAEYSETMCRIFDLSRTKFQGNDNNLEFSETFPRLGAGPDIQYQATICSLPREAHCQSLHFALPEVQGNVFVVKPRNWDTMTCINQVSEFDNPIPHCAAADWSPLITYRFSRNSHHHYNLTVTFSLAPTEFKFDEYLVSLYKMAGLQHPFKECKLHTKTPSSCNTISHLAQNNAKSGTVIFVDIPENRYMLEVQAKDPFWREHDYALCFSVQESGKHRRKECLRTRMKNIVIGEGPDEPQSATESNILLSTSEDGERPGETRTATKRNIPPGTSDNKTKTLLIAAGVCLCLVCMSTVILIIIFTRKHVQVKDEWVRMRRVYLLAYDDHAAHTDAVKALATLLKKHCNCDVIYPKWFIPDIRKTGLYEWISTQIDKSDFVVLVNSKVAYSRYTARNWDTHFRVEDSGPEADAFSFSTSHLRSKEGKPDFLYTTIMAYFNYTNTNDLIPFNPGLHYKLPENVLDLVNHIHDCNKSSLGESDILGTTEGKALVKAVDEAKAYQQRVPEWFSTRVFMHESGQGLVLNSASTCTQVLVDPEDLIPTLKDVSAMACTDRSSETQDVSIDTAEAVTLVLEAVRSSTVETEFPTNDEFATNVCPASGLGKSQESKQFSPEHFYPPGSCSESLCTDELEDRLFAITSDSYINNVRVSF